MSTTTVERISSNSLRLSNPDLPGGEIEVKGGNAEAAVSIALEFLKGLGSQGPVATSATAVHLANTEQQPKRRRRKLRPWTDEEIAGLGTMSDAAYAKKVKRTPGAITAQRKVKKVDAFNGGAKRGRKAAAATAAV